MSEQGWAQRVRRSDWTWTPAWWLTVSLLADAAFVVLRLVRDQTMQLETFAYVMFGPVIFPVVLLLQYLPLRALRRRGHARPMASVCWYMSLHFACAVVSAALAPSLGGRSDAGVVIMALISLLVAGSLVGWSLAMASAMSAPRVPGSPPGVGAD